ncbi:MAG: hypothetical protein ACYDEG_10465, partial [bacterium]
MTANSKYIENSAIDVIDVIDYRILHTVSHEFNGDFKRFQKNIRKNKSLESLKIKGVDTYIDSIYRIKEEKDNYSKEEKCYSLEEDYKYLSEIFIYRNKALTGRLSEKWILIILPSFPLKTVEACASLFFLISESIITIVKLIRPPKANGLKISNVDEMIKTICYLQKPQDLEIDKKAVLARFKHRDIKNFVDNLFDNKNKDTYSLSEIFFIAYYFLFYLLGKSKHNSKNKHNKSYKYYNEFLNVFNTTLFTTSILFIPPSMFSDAIFIEKIPNLIYSYDGTAKKRDFVNDISISDDSKFFMTYNRFLMVFKEGKDLEEEKDHWVSRAFVVNEIISGIFYSLHYFANEYAKLVKKKFTRNRRTKKQFFLNRVMEYSSSFFDPNFSQAIWRLLDESFKINEFTVVLKTIKDNIIMSETIKLNKSILSVTFVLVILTIVLILLAIIQ